MLLNEQEIEYAIKKSAYADYIAENLLILLIIGVVPLCFLLIFFRFDIPEKYIFLKNYFPYIQHLLMGGATHIATAHFVFHLYIFISIIYYFIKCRLPSIRMIALTLHSFKYTCFTILCIIISLFTMIVYIYIIYGHTYQNCTPNDIICHINQSQPSDSLLYNLTFFAGYSTFWFLFLNTIKFTHTQHIYMVDYNLYKDTKKSLRQSLKSKMKLRLVR